MWRSGATERAQWPDNAVVTNGSMFVCRIQPRSLEGARVATASISPSNGHMIPWDARLPLIRASRGRTARCTCL